MIKRDNNREAKRSNAECKRKHERVIFETALACGPGCGSSFCCYVRISVSKKILRLLFQIVHWKKTHLSSGGPLKVPARTVARGSAVTGRLGVRGGLMKRRDCSQRESTSTSLVECESDCAPLPLLPSPAPWS